MLRRNVSICMFSLALAGLAGGCGPTESAPEPPRAAAAPGSVDELVARECGRCHNGQRENPVIKTAAQLKTTRGAKGRVESGNMPPDRTLPAAVKSQLNAL